MKPTWLNFISISLLLFGTFACSPISTSTPLPPSTSSPQGGATTKAPASTNQPAQQNSPGAATTKPAVGGQPAPAGVPLLLQVLSPQDGAVVNTSQIQVSGLASPGEVVTVNDNILLVGGDGQFQTTVALDQGPNLIEVIASNNAGAETNVELTITYQP